MKNKIYHSLFFLGLICKSYGKVTHTSSTDNSSNVNINNYQEPKNNFTISGYITESGSGENLLGASIYVPELKRGTTTNDYGFFSLSLPKGKHTVYISSIGYTTIIKEVDITGDLSLNITLETDTQSLDEVIVSAESKVKESKVTQMSKIQINPSTVADVPALLGEKDVLKTLQLLPGIQAGSEGSSGFFVRGGTPDQNLIILDDAVVYNSNHLFGFFSVFNGDAIKSVEAFKGGFPARFGGRLSSVIKIDMKDGNKEKLSGKVNIGLISSSLLLEGPINKGKTSFILSGRRTYADILAQPFLSEENGKGGYYFADLNFKIHHIFSEKDKLYWSNYYGRDKFYASYKDQFTDEKVKLGWGNITSTLRWNHQFNDKLFANTSLIYSNYDFNISDEYTDTYDDDDDVVEYLFKTNSGIEDFTLKSSFDYYPNSKNTLRFGAEITNHSFTPQRILLKDTYAEDIDRTEELNSLEGAMYIEDDWKITDKLRSSLGLRLSYFNYNDTNYINPETRLAFSYNLKPDLALKASYAKMNQYIHLLSSSGIGLPTDLWVSSTDNVKPQTSQQFAVGIAKDFFDKDYSLTLEGYYKNMNDIIAYKEGASFLALDNLESGADLDWEENITAGEGWAYGAEILLRKQTGKLTGWLGYTLSWSERQFEELNHGNKFYDRYDRRHDISAVGIYKPSDRFTFSATWVLSTGNNYTLPNLQRIDGTFPIGVSNFFNRGLQDIATQRNNFRGETSHRLDLGWQFHKKKKKGRERTWAISLYNAYARQNPFIYTVDTKYPNYNDPNGTEEKELTRTSVLILIPSINYIFKF